MKKIILFLLLVIVCCGVSANPWVGSWIFKDDYTVQQYIFFEDLTYVVIYINYKLNLVVTMDPEEYSYTEDKIKLNNGIIFHHYYQFDEDKAIVRLVIAHEYDIIVAWLERNPPDRKRTFEEIFRDAYNKSENSRIILFKL